MNKNLCLLASLTFASAAAAFEAPLEVEGDSFKFTAQALMIDKDSDGDTRSSKFEADYRKKTGDWAQSYAAESISIQTDSGSDTETYKLDAKGMRFFNDTLYSFMKASAYKDVQSEYEYSLSPTFGVGNELFKNTKNRLVAEIGLGGEYLSAKSSLAEDEFEPVATLGGLFEHSFNDSVGFEQEVDSSFGDQLTRTDLSSRLSAKLSQRLSATLNYEVKLRSTETDNQTDQITSVGVSFKTP